MTNIQKIKKELGITDKEIAEFFGYKNVYSYRNSSGKPKIEQGIISLYNLFTSWESIVKKNA